MSESDLPSDLQKVYRALQDRAQRFGSDVEVYTTTKNFVFGISGTRIFAEITLRKRGHYLPVLIRPEGYAIAERETHAVNGIPVYRHPDSHG